MTLSDFLAQHPETDAGFAERIGVTRQSLHRYKSGERRPEWDIIDRIAAATNGLVTANDFMSVRLEGDVADPQGVVGAAS